MRVTKIRPMSFGERQRSKEREAMNSSEVRLIQRMIHGLKRDIERLRDKYPGVRPGWVSGDIGTMQMQILKYQEELKAMREGDTHD